MTDEQAIAILERGIPGDGVTWEQIQEATARAVAALRAGHVDTNKNVPLEMEQLRDMENKVVFVDITSKEFQRICGLKSQLGIAIPKENRIQLFNGRSVYFSSHGSWKAYAYQTAHIDRESWEPCGACKDGKITIHVPQFRAIAVCNQHMDHGAFDIELRTKFCPWCGRPLTPEAWDELEKRLKEGVH